MNGGKFTEALSPLFKFLDHSGQGVQILLQCLVLTGKAPTLNRNCKNLEALNGNIFDGSQYSRCEEVLFTGQHYSTQFTPNVQSI